MIKAHDYGIIVIINAYFLHDLAKKGPKSELLEHQKVLYHLKNLLSI